MKKDNVVVFFPRMIKFEINTNSIEADPDKITSDPKFTKITIIRLILFINIYTFIKYNRKIYNKIFH